MDAIEGENRVEQIAVSNKKTGEKKKIAVDGVFIAVGIEPESAPFKGTLEMDKQGYIIAGGGWRNFSSGRVCSRRCAHEAAAPGDHSGSGRGQLCHQRGEVSGREIGGNVQMETPFKALACLCTVAALAAAAPFGAQAAINLETDASVAGVSVAMNNYYAGSLDPETELAEAFSSDETLAR